MGLLPIRLAVALAGLYIGHFPGGLSADSILPATSADSLVVVLKTEKDQDKFDWSSLDHSRFVKMFIGTSLLSPELGTCGIF